MPLFSIIVPVYKIEKYLAECIESILAQTCQDYEVILVDDGSPDSCPEICDYYSLQNKKFRVIHKKNGGLVSARRAGANVSTGKYILNVDGDDFLNNTLLEEIKNVVVQYEPDIVAFNFRKVSEIGNFIEGVSNKFPSGLYKGEKLAEICKKLLFDVEERNINGNTGSIIYGIWSKAIKRDLYIPLQNQVPLDIKNGEDVAVTIPAICKCETLFIVDEFGYNYRIHDKSMVNSFREGEMQRLITLIHFLRTHADKVSDESIVGYAYRQIENHIIAASRNMEQYGQFRKYLEEIINLTLLHIINNFDDHNLQIKYKLRCFTIKRRMFWMIWLLYHK